MTNFPEYDDSEPATPEAKDVVLVMDTSRSMSADQLRDAKEAAITILDTMSPKDQGSNAQLYLERVQVSLVVLEKNVLKVLNMGQNLWVQVE